MEHYVILHNQVPYYVQRDPCYGAMAKYVALRNATYLAIATVFGLKNQELLMFKYTSHMRISYFTYYKVYERPSSPFFTSGNTAAACKSSLLTNPNLLQAPRQRRAQVDSTESRLRT